ncbi:hypothetical protein [Halobacteriovorax sp.]
MTISFSGIFSEAHVTENKSNAVCDGYYDDDVDDPCIAGKE